jgi:hypothetical protein
LQPAILGLGAGVTAAVGERVFDALSGWRGPDSPPWPPTMDNELRFYAALWGAYGVVLLLAALDYTGWAGRVPWLAAVFFDGYDRDEPVVVRVAGADFLPMHLIFEDEDARVLRTVHHEPIPTVQDCAVAVSGVERHQRLTPLNLRRKARENISIFENRVFGDRVEVVVAIDRTGQPLHDDVEEWVERHECSVFGVGHELAP